MAKKKKGKKCPYEEVEYCEMDCAKCPTVDAVVFMSSESGRKLLGGTFLERTLFGRMLLDDVFPREMN
jgi:hypothetical protein